MCGKDCCQHQAVTPADVDEMLEWREVICLDDILGAATRHFGHRAIEDSVILGVFSPIIPNALAVQTSKGVFPGSRAMQQVTPGPQGVFAARMHCPSAHRCGG